MWREESELTCLQSKGFKSLCTYSPVPMRGLGRALLSMVVLWNLGSPCTRTAQVHALVSSARAVGQTAGGSPARRDVLPEAVLTEPGVVGGEPGGFLGGEDLRAGPGAAAMVDGCDDATSGASENSVHAKFPGFLAKRRASTAAVFPRKGFFQAAPAPAEAAESAIFAIQPRIYPAVIVLHLRPSVLLRCLGDPAALTCSVLARGCGAAPLAAHAGRVPGQGAGAGPPKLDRQARGGCRVRPGSNAPAQVIAPGVRPACQRAALSTGLR